MDMGHRLKNHSSKFDADISYICKSIYGYFCNLAKRNGNCQNGNVHKRNTHVAGIAMSTFN